MENHNQAFIVYKKLNIKNRTLIHFDAHIDMNWIPVRELDIINAYSGTDSLFSFLKSPYEYYIPGKRFLHVGNWIYPLLMDESISQFYWVVPDREILSQGWLTLLKKGLKLYQKNITASDIQSFRVNKKLKRIQGQIYGKALFICTIKNIPHFNSPIILDIDTDYFDFNSALFLERLKNPLFWPDDFIHRLTQKEIEADIVTICYSLQNGYNTLALRFMGQDLQRAVQAGAKISSSAKRLIKLHRQLYRAAFDNVQVDLDSARRLLVKEFPVDAASFYLLSRKYAAEGNQKASLDNLKIAAHLDKEYKFAALHRANNLYYDKDYGRALSLYEKIIGQNLLTTNFIFRKMADCNRILGRLDKAEKIYRMLIRREPDNLELQPALQEVFFRTGKRAEAEALGKSGIKSATVNH